MKKFLWLTLMLLLFFVSSTCAGEADVIAVQVGHNGEGTYTFDVTVSHADTGWEHYANKWDILDEKGEVLGTRTLHHPHVNEQPFTRSLTAVEISQSIKKVRIRAHDSVHQYGGRVVSVRIP